jgi:hypothetical protein
VVRDLLTVSFAERILVLILAVFSKSIRAIFERLCGLVVRVPGC